MLSYLWPKSENGFSLNTGNNKWRTSSTICCMFSKKVSLARLSRPGSLTAKTESNEWQDHFGRVIKNEGHVGRGYAGAYTSGLWAVVGYMYLNVLHDACKITQRIITQNNKAIIYIGHGQCWYYMVTFYRAVQNVPPACIMYGPSTCPGEADQPGNSIWPFLETIDQLFHPGFAKIWRLTSNLCLCCLSMQEGGWHDGPNKSNKI